MCNSVLLPQPLGPHSETKLLCSMARLTPESASTERPPAAKRFSTLISSI